MKLVDGLLTIDSRPDDGTSINATVPRKLEYGAVRGDFAHC